MKVIVRTDTGFRLRTMKLSARCIMNRVNLLHRMRSISSACLILMLSLIELIEGSIRTLSFSFREMISGFRRTSLDVLENVNESLIRMKLQTYEHSTSGLLCRSTT